MHDYYRIADVWDGSRRTQQAQVRAPWWRTLPEPSAGRASRVSGRVRVLEPEVADATGWRDDVALDFPSLRAPAERMRQAFLAHDDAAHSTSVTVDVVLLRAQTLRPRRVPVRVPLTACCARCGGRGETWGDTCLACEGDGSRDEPRYVLLRVPPDVRDGARLRYRLDGGHAPGVVIDARVRVR